MKKLFGCVCVCRLLLPVFLLLCSVTGVNANNIRVDGKTRVVNVAGDTAVIEVTLRWDNSWRDDFNWDAAWVFFKFKKRGISELWKHVYLGREGHHAFPQSGNEGSDYMFMSGETSGKVTGLFVMRKAIAEGNVNVRLQVKWPLSGTGLSRDDFGNNYDRIYVAVHAVEMVYVPYGGYYLGDNFSRYSFTAGDTSALLMDSEDAFVLSSRHGKPAVSLATSYPKGYAGFYVMKYETSQEQYVEFLNSLTLEQQKARVENNDFSHMKRGDYVFGDISQPSCRNGIVFIEQRQPNTPAVFGNDLNPDNDFFAADDGQTLACNYMSPNDMLAYCDWSGLRPMSELEYEKACRRPFPQIPDRGEYAWNTNSGVNRLTGLGDLNFRGDEREQAINGAKNVNSGGGLNGPVRCGLFATSGTNQLQSGATYWGVMDMSGNLWEMCYNATAAGVKFVADNVDYSHGNGELNAGGATDIASGYWPVSVGTVGVRGGSFTSADSLLRTSDRTNAFGTYFAAMTQRDSTVGFRGVCSAFGVDGFKTGRIYCENGLEQDTVCSGVEFMIQGDSVENAMGKVAYSWYISEDKGATWTMMPNESRYQLFSYSMENHAGVKEYYFKRKVVCPIGEAVSTVKIVLNPAGTDAPCVKSVYYGQAGIPLKLHCLSGESDVSAVWKDMSGAKVAEGYHVQLNSFVSGGIYKVHYVNQYGCLGEATEFRIVQPAQKITIVQHPDGYRMWSNGTYAASAEEYRHPQPPYYYEGDTGNGVYRIEINCSKYAPFDIYCDMTNNDGGWMRIMGKVGSTGMRNYQISADVMRYLFEDSKKEIAVSAEETNSITEPAWRLSDVSWSLSLDNSVSVWQAASNVANGLTPRGYNWGNTTKGYFVMDFQLDKTASGYNYIIDGCYKKTYVGGRASLRWGSANDNMHNNEWSHESCNRYDCGAMSVSSKYNYCAQTRIFWLK
ncbi:SUMF1/EgtB/PvdO family nonheme iron enzyme [Odoribacter lunatus]|uniref:SUMF1/EgtB/PvdO family nonheme iron enzyme n=1 Tax=Odoribacter lunatus TaxID=2941335 RepID=UPI0020405D21|nr:SUMF1/EgtB/PvdO family nonheme iron enzyme [Odoribacter lunatus]